jgi:hypothetical protein
MKIEKEVYDNFIKLNYREFENFMKEYEVRNQAEIERLKKLNKKYSPKISKDNLKPKLPKVEIPEFNEEGQKIIYGIRRGHSISFIFNGNPECCESIVQCIAVKRRKAYDNEWKHWSSPSEMFITGNNKYLSDADWSELFPHSLILSTGTLESLLEFKLAPHDVKDVIAKSCKTKTEITLVQSYLVERMHNNNLHRSLRDYLFKHKKEPRSYMTEKPVETTVMDFAINVLGIAESRYKWLKRIGENLPHLRNLKGRVNLECEGLLEKLSYLGTAMKVHCNNPALIIDAINTVSAKRFRAFAKNKLDDLSYDPITPQEYRKAKPYIDKLHAYQAEGKSVTVIGLHSEYEQMWLNQINQALNGEGEHYKKFYPGVVWDTTLQVEHTTEISSDGVDNVFSYLNVNDVLKKAA